MIVENLKSYVVSLYDNAGHEMKEFGDILAGYGGSKSSGFNFIFDLEKKRNSINNYTKNIMAVLDYADGKESPFLYIKPRESNNPIELMLLKHNFKKVGEATCVSLDHIQYKKNNSKKPFVVKRVNSEKQLKDWCAIMDDCFGMCSNDTFRVFSPAMGYLLGEASGHLLFTMYDQNNEPIAISLLYLDQGKNLSAGHYCWGTKEGFRNQGAMSYLVEEMIYIAKEKGYQNSIAQSFPTSIRITERLGFCAQNSIDIFSNA